MAWYKYIVKLLSQIQETSLYNLNREDTKNITILLHFQIHFISFLIYLQNQTTYMKLRLSNAEQEISRVTSFNKI